MNFCPLTFITHQHSLVEFFHWLFPLYFRVNDIITQVNDINVENVLHSTAVQALKDSGNSARLVSLLLMVSFDGHFSLMHISKLSKSLQNRSALFVLFFFLFLFFFFHFPNILFESHFCHLFCLFSLQTVFFPGLLHLTLHLLPSTIKSLYSCRSSIALLMQFCFTFGMTVLSHF